MRSLKGLFWHLSWSKFSHVQISSWETNKSPPSRGTSAFQWSSPQDIGYLSLCVAHGWSAINGHASHVLTNSRSAVPQLSNFSCTKVEAVFSKLEKGQAHYFLKVRRWDSQPITRPLKNPRLCFLFVTFLCLSNFAYRLQWDVQLSVENILLTTFWNMSHIIWGSKPKLRIKKFILNIWLQIFSTNSY